MVTYQHLKEGCSRNLYTNEGVFRKFIYSLNWCGVCAYFKVKTNELKFNDNIKMTTNTLKNYNLATWKYLKKKA